MRKFPLHPAWGVAAVTLFGLLAASAFRSSFGVLLQPWEQAFGWSRATTSGAASLNLVLYGLSAPVAAAVMEHWGLRRTVVASLATSGLAAVASLWMQRPWQLWLLWGVVVGIGTGALALTFGAIVANRWFERRRGLVTGAFSAASAAGQVVFVPVVAMAVQGPGWRWAVGVVAGATLLAALLCLLLLRDHPAQLGVAPLGAEPGAPLGAEQLVPLGAEPGAPLGAEQLVPLGAEPAAAPVAARAPGSEGPRTNPLAATWGVVLRHGRRRAFWALLATFFVCGWSTNGIIQTHFVPAAHDHSMPMTTAAGMLGLVGIFDVVGTIASGWLTDRVDARWLLAAYYVTRGLSLVPINHLLASHITPALWLWIVFYGLDWTATVPPTVALCREHFGLADSGIVFGWVYAAHMVGAGIGASVSGSLRAADGTYTAAWALTAGLCLAAGAVSLAAGRGSATVSPAASGGTRRRR